MRPDPEIIRQLVNNGGQEPARTFGVVDAPGLLCGAEFLEGMPVINTSNDWCTGSIAPMFWIKVEEWR
jgi:hypothetical protein